MTVSEPESVKAALIPAHVQPRSLRLLHLRRARCRKKESRCYLKGLVYRRGQWTLAGSDKLRKRKGVRETCMINQNSINQAKRRRCKIRMLYCFFGGFFARAACVTTALEGKKKSALSVQDGVQ